MILFFCVILMTFAEYHFLTDLQPSVYSHPAAVVAVLDGGFLPKAV